MSVVEMKSVGPISSIVFDLPTGFGGVKVLRGTSGVGKTTALRVLSGLIGDKSALSGLTPSDGCTSGEVKGLGRTVKIGQRISSAGSAEVPHLSGLDVSVLVDPKVADPVARTKARVRCLVSIGGKQVKPEDLLGDQFKELSGLIDIDEARRFDDPVAMADYLKRALDKAALDVERQSDRKAGEAEAKRREAGDTDKLTGAGTYEEAVAAHRAAMQAVSSAKQGQTKYRSALSANETVAKQIAMLETAGVQSLDEMRATLTKKESTVEGLKARYDAAKADYVSFKQKLEAAEQDAKRLDSLRSSVVEVGAEITDETISVLEVAESEALEKLNDAASVASRAKAFKESVAIQNESAQLAEKSVQLRAAAQSVQSEVQKALPVGPIQVEDGVLVVQQDKRKKRVPLEALSTGEKWRIAMEYAIASVGTGGVFPLDQEAWQSLGPELKDEIALQCRSACVWLITGEIGEGSLRVEDYEIDND